MTLVAVRKKFQGNKAGLIVATALVGIAIVIATHYFLTRDRPLRNDVTFFSDDDGKTFYKDSIFKFPPFEHDGAVVNRAVVFTDDGKTFVGYLERYTPQTRKALQDVYDANPDAHYKVLQAMASMQVFSSGIEWKYPGSGHQWTLHGRGTPVVLPPNGGEDVSNLLIVRP